jgi:hypothetical protein
MSKTINALSLAAAGLLAACGGGSDDQVDMPAPPAAANEVPASALASATAYTQFAVSQSPMASDTDEPLSATNVDLPPGSETDEPVSVG